MRVPAPRLGQLVHLFSVNPISVFGHRDMLPSMRRHRDPIDTDAALPSPTSTSSDVDSKSDVETVPDDRTLVKHKRHSSKSDEIDAMLLSDVPEDEVCLTPRCTSRRPPTGTSFEPLDPTGRLSIIYPLPTAEKLLAHDYTHQATAMDAPVAPSLYTPTALAPPATHYKRRRARIISNEDHDPDSDEIYNRPNIDPDTTLLFPF